MLLLGAACGAVLLWSLLSGSADIPLRELGEVARGGGDAVARTVVLDLRLPRVLTAFGVGAVLALAGLLLQALFRNPLADPYVLGVSGVSRSWLAATTWLPPSARKLNWSVSPYA